MVNHLDDFNSENGELAMEARFKSEIGSRLHESRLNQLLDLDSVALAVHTYSHWLALAEEGIAPTDSFLRMLPSWTASLGIDQRTLVMEVVGQIGEFEAIKTLLPRSTKRE